jgi:hypothetical protein
MMSLMYPDSTSFSVTSSLGFVSAICNEQPFVISLLRINSVIKIQALVWNGTGDYPDPFTIKALVNLY